MQEYNQTNKDCQDELLGFAWPKKYLDTTDRGLGFIAGKKFLFYFLLSIWDQRRWKVWKSRGGMEASSNTRSFDGQVLLNIWSTLPLLPLGSSGPGATLECRYFSTYSTHISHVKNWVDLLLFLPVKIWTYSKTRSQNTCHENCWKQEL